VNNQHYRSEDAVAPFETIREACETTDFGVAPYHSDGDVTLGGEPITTDDVTLASEWLARHPPAVQGQGGRRTTWVAVTKLLGHFSLAPAVALELIVSTYNPGCRPPWDVEALRSMVDRAWNDRYPGQAPGAEAPAGASAHGAAQTEEPMATPDAVGAAYAIIMSGMSLSQEDARGLRTRGLSDADVARLGYRSWGGTIDHRKQLLGSVHTAIGDAMYAVPGVYRTDFGPELGLRTGTAIPVRDADGRIRGIRLRTERQKSNKKGKPVRDSSGKLVFEKVYMWLSGRHDHAKDARVVACCHVPLHEPTMDTSVVAITEGELKADIATMASGVLYVSVPGVGSWRLGVEQAKALGASRVLLAYDVDADANRGVADAIVRSLELARELGMGVAIQTWAKSAGKGIDDVLVRDASAVRTLEGEDAAAFVEKLARKHDLRGKPTEARSIFDELVEEVEAPSAGAEPGNAAPPQPGTATPTRHPTYPLTDLGNAERMVCLHRENLRYVGVWGKWLVWDGARWQVDETERVLRCAQITARSVYKEAAVEADPEKRAALVAHARRSESTPRVRAMIVQAAALPGMSVRPADLDRDPWLLNCPNGTLDLRQGTLHEHRREDLITKVTRATFDPDAKCSLWESFLDRVQPDKDVQTFLGRLSGYSLTGDVSEHVLPIHHGRGRNGKGVFTNTKLHVLGDYAQAIPTDLLMQKRGETHPTEKTVLFGIRFAAASESEEGRSMNVALVKAFTGGDPISARRMREDFWVFHATHKIELSTNHRPIIRETADAIWERVHLVPWAVQIPKSERDKKLETKLKAEAAGILAWMVRHCVDWQQDGLAVPESVRAATASYREAEDLFAIFLTERAVLDAKAEAEATALQEAYKAWAEARNEKELSHKALSSKLEERGFAKGRDSKTGRTVWSGLRLHGGSTTPQPGDQRQYEGVTADDLEELFVHSEVGTPEGSEGSEGRSGMSAHDAPASSSTENSLRILRNLQDTTSAVHSSDGNNVGNPDSSEGRTFPRPDALAAGVPVPEAPDFAALASEPPTAAPPNAPDERPVDGLTEPDDGCTPTVLDPTLPHGDRAVRIVRGFASTGRLELEIELSDGYVTRVAHDTRYRDDELKRYVYSVVDESQLTVATFEQRRDPHGVGCQIVRLRRPTPPAEGSAA
jgi:putative DNA primase/helicase